VIRPEQRVGQVALETESGKGIKEMAKKRVGIALAVFVTAALLMGLLSKSDVVKSAYCWDCWGNCKKCVWTDDHGWQCQTEEIRNNFFCYCTGGGASLCNLSYDKVCAQKN